MKPEIENLLGGYATRTLNLAEEQLLLEAALEDQEVFDALAREQVMRDVLDDSGARRELLAALEPKRSSWSRLGAWITTPMVLAAAGAAALLVVTISTVRHGSSSRAPVQVAREAAPRRPDIAPEPLPQAIKPAPPLVPETESKPRLGQRRNSSGPAGAPQAVSAAPALAAERRTEPEPKPLLDREQQRADTDLKLAKSKKERDATDQPSQPAPAPAPTPPAQTVAATSSAPAGAPSRELFANQSRQRAAPAPGTAGALRLPEASVAKGDSRGESGNLATIDFGLRAGFQRNGAPVDAADALAGKPGTQLAVVPNADGFLYVLAHQATGWKSVWQTHVAAGRSYAPPAEAAVPDNTDALVLALSRRQVTLSKTTFTDSEIEVLFPRSPAQITSSAQGALVGVDPGRGDDALVVLRLDLGRR